MTVIDASGRTDVIVRTGPAEWWQILAAFTPLAALLGLVLVVGISWYSAQRSTPTQATMRAEWWDRAEWAMDMAMDARPERRRAGLAALEQLGTSDLMGKDDAKILAQAKAILKRP